MHSKDPRAAALEARLRTTHSPWDRLPLLLELTREPTRNDPAYALGRAQEALSLARQLNDKFWIARSMRSIGVFLLRTARYSEVLYYLEEAARMFAELNETAMKAQTDMPIAGTYIYMQNAEAALQRIFPCLDIFKRLGDRYWLTVTYRSIGNAYKLLDEHGVVIRNYRKALSIALRAGLRDDVGSLYVNISETYGKIGDEVNTRKYLLLGMREFQRTDNRAGIMGAASAMASQSIRINDYEGAEKYVRLTGTMSRAYNYPIGEALSWTHMGEIYRSREEWARARHCYRKAIAIARKTESIPFQSIALQKLGELYVSTGEFRKSIRPLQEALDLYGPLGQTFSRYNIHAILAQAREGMGNQTEALRHMKEYRRLKEESMNAEKLRQTSRAEVNGRIRKMIRELKKANATNDTLLREIEKKETELLALTLNLVQKDEENRKGGRTINCSTDDAGNFPLNNWDIFARQFHRVYHQFYPDLLKRFPTLTATEIKVCSLIRTGISSGEIARVLGISKRTVDNHRARIHRKMDLPGRSSLADFIMRI